MNRFLRIVVLTGLASAPLAFGETTEFRTPQRLIRGEMHWPLKPVEEAWWYDRMDTQEREVTGWSVDAWAGYYGMNAGSAFFKPNGGITTDTASLSTLWFGTDSFVGIDVLSANPGAAVLTTVNPFLGFAAISPTFSYSEKGAVFGLRAMRTFGCNDEWHTGVRVSLPVKEIEIAQDANAALEETLSDVVRQVPTNLASTGTPNQVDFAYRLDFLTSLGYVGTGGVLVPIVQYGDATLSGTPPSYLPTDTKIGGVDMTSTLPSADNATGTCPNPSNYCYPPAYVLRSTGTNSTGSVSCGSSSSSAGFDIVPAPPFYRYASQVTGYVNADGSGGTDGSALFFRLTGQNYKTGGLATDTDAQSDLFVVPRATGTGSAFQLTQGSQQIYSKVNAILNIIDPLATASTFFAQNGINLTADEHIVGVGDLTVEWFIGYGDRQEWYIDGIIGAIFPTGTNPGTANQIYLKPTGNNKHYEIKLGLEGGYNWCDQLALRGEVFYGHAFSKTESRAAVFNSPTTTTTPIPATGSTNLSNSNSCCSNNNTDPCALYLKNIGTPLCVDVSWNWFYGRLDLTVFHPYNSDLGMTFGYEFYWKGHDNIDMDCGSCTSTVMARDLLGTVGTVDFSGMERNSQTLSNKLYGEIFHRWSFFELFAGASQVVSGENVMKETEAHLGLRLYF